MVCHQRINFILVEHVCCITRKLNLSQIAMFQKNTNKIYMQTLLIDIQLMVNASMITTSNGISIGKHTRTLANMLDRFPINNVLVECIPPRVCVGLFVDIAISRADKLCMIVF